MEELELINEILKKKHLNIKTHLFLDGLKVKHLKFGSFTDPQKQMILKIAQENGVIKVVNETRIPYSQPTTSYEIQEHPKSVLSEEERKEIFQFMKDCASGLHSKEDAASYAEMLARMLSERGVKVKSFDQEKYFD